MAVLARSRDGVLSMQCDVCTPPVLTINTQAELRRTGWALRSSGERLDSCPNCSVHVAPRNRRPRRDPSPTDPDPARLPNVIVVGAAKAGTTSLLNYLAGHPEIAVSEIKEMRFFQDPDCRDWVGRYQSQFRKGTLYRAEATPMYSKTPCFPGVVDRTADLLPDARILYLVRDPIDRLVSEYVEQAQWRAAGGPLEQQLHDAWDPENHLVASSRYATQLRDYRRRFPDDQIMVLDLADLSHDPVSVMGRVFDFLGLDHMTMSHTEFRRFNSRDDKFAFPEWVMRMRRGPLVRASHKLPSRPREWIRDLAWCRLRTPVERPALSKRNHRDLENVLGPETSDLRELTGQSFATWSI